MPVNPEKFEPEFEAEKEERKPEEKERIQSLEKLELGTQDRMNLILTYLEKKPASTVEIEYFAKHPLITIEEVMKKRDDVERILKNAGLKIRVLEIESTDEDGFDQKEFKFLVSKSEEKLDKLEKAIQEGDDERLGLLFGFPETAVKAFVKGKKKGKLGETMLDIKEWWKKLPSEEKKFFLEEKVLNFLNFKLSKDHWQKELKTVKEWEEILKEKAPELYQEIHSKKPEAIMTEAERKRYERKEAEKELEAIRKKVEKLQDALGSPIEEGVKETVVMLNAFDIRTAQSCEGHFEKERIVAPWVLIYPREPQVENWFEDEELREKVKKQSLAMKRKLIELLTEFYEERKIPFDAMLGFKGVGYGFKLQSIGAEVLPHLPKEQQRKKFLAYKKEIEEFTKFLKKKYPDYAF